MRTRERREARRSAHSASDVLRDPRMVGRRWLVSNPEAEALAVRYGCGSFEQIAQAYLNERKVPYDGVLAWHDRRKGELIVLVSAGCA